MASQLGETGRLDIVDVQPAMLDHVMRRAADRGITAITPTVADATTLPFPDASFDAAYLVTVLGEIPDPARAVGELGRVLKPGGRLIVGECIDRHFVPLVRLLRYGGAAGMAPGIRLGPPLCYLALFHRGRGPGQGG